MTKRTLKDGVVLITLWECPHCGEREGYPFKVDDCPNCHIDEFIARVFDNIEYNSI